MLSHVRLARRHLQPLSSKRWLATFPSIHRQAPFRATAPASQQVPTHASRIMSPLPLPLQEHDTKHNPYAQHDLYPSSALVEQQAILQVLLANGNLPRAKAVWKRMVDGFLKQRQSSLEDDAEAGTGMSTVKDLVPMHTHASFLRAFFRAALGISERLGDHTAAVTEAPETVRWNKRQRRTFVTEAWDWWHMLRTQSREYGLADAQAVAALIKGSIQMSKTDDPSLEHQDRLIRAVESLPGLGYSLTDIVQEPIFDSEAPAALGYLPPQDVLEHLSELVRSSGKPTLSRLVTAAQSQIDQEQQQQSLSSDGVLSSSPTTLGRRSDPLEGVTKLDPTFHSPTSDDPDHAAVSYKLETLRSHLSSITGHRSEHSDPYLRQKLLEESAYDVARQQYDYVQQQLKDAHATTPASTRGMKDYVWEWTQQLSRRISEELAGMADDKSPRVSKASYHSNEHAFLSFLPPEKLAFTAVTVLLSAVTEDGPVHDGATVSAACVYLGKAVEREHMATTMAELDPKAFTQRLKKVREQNPFIKSKEHALSTMWKEHQRRMKEGGEEQESVAEREEAEVRPRREESIPLSNQGIEWTQAIRVRVGAQLIAWLLEVATITRTAEVTEVGEDGRLEEKTVSEDQPAFLHSYLYIQGTKVGVIRVNEHILGKLEHDPLDMTLYTRPLPMVIPPRPWLDWDQGGYITQRSEVVRLNRNSAEQAANVKAASAAGHMSEVYEALDYLGQTPWRVNRSIYDVVSEVWNSGECVGDIPAKDPLINMTDPEKPADFDESIESRQSYRRLLQQTAKDRLNAHSQRCTLNYQLEIARAFIGETIYFPHNMDFRGRAYPIPPNLSHIGDDLSRGLLQFSQSKPLGTRGLYWLKVHFANTFGYDKFSFDERAAFADQHLEDISDSAKQPLKGQRWWTKAEDPWQCLAACFEIHAAYASGDPESYQSCLPVQQDGTCNGLQHYAALGGDLAGAEAVNLVNAERPGDVYGRVAAQVSRAVDQEAAQGVEIAQLLQGKITRKTVKQTVMTTVYGVTFIGAKKMIQKQLTDSEAVPEARIFEASVYLAHLTFRGIGDLFKGATAFQKWLAYAARLVSASHPEYKIASEKNPSKMTTMAWTTPLGLPVVQPYRQANRKQVNTALQTIFLEDPNTPSAVDTRGQQSAMPPNYIHSLDATHMMLTALECKKAGVAFASVHDSFWTHAADVDVLASNLRRAFVDLHSRPLLEDLRNEILQRYAGFQIAPADIPDSGRSSLGLKPRSAGKKKKSQDNEASKATPASEEDSGMEYDDLDDLAVPSETDGPSSEAQDSLWSGDLTEEDMSALRPPSDRTESAPIKKGKALLLADVLPKLPPRGDFDIQQVGESSYFFS